MKASDLFLKCLEAQGIDTIFGVPGEENADIMISLLKSKIKFITCRHEQSAAFMADMYGRLTGKPGVCLATLGPGATNLITGVANANMDHSPVIAIVGQASTNRLHKESHQNMDAVSMYEPVTKWATTIRDASVIPEVIYKACKVAMEGKPGAVMIELPEDIAKDDTDVKPILPRKKSIRESGVSSHRLETALSLIAKSKKPLVLIGAGCNRDVCESSLKEFIDKTKMYFAATFMGKGALSVKHANALYCVGLGMKDIAVKAFDQADLVICIGYDMVEWHPERWNNKGKKTIIHIDVLPSEVDAHYIPDIELIGNINNTLEQLNKHLNKNHVKNKDLFVKLKKQIVAELHQYDNDEGFPVKPQRALADIRNVLADDDILISDVGAHKMWVARHYHTYAPKSCFITNGFCSMGGAIPGAVTAKKLHPNKNVVALCGDGGFIMSIQALVTAVELKLPIVVIVWVDNCYGLIKWKQEMTYHTYSHVDFYNPDLNKTAEAFGCNSIAITKVSDLKPALKKAFTEKNKPTVITIPIDYKENMKLTKHLGELVSH